MAANLYEVLSSTLWGKLLLIAVLVLILQVPIVRIESLIHERQATKETAFSMIAADAGGPQRISGPVLRVPFTVEGRAEKNSSRRGAFLLPDVLRVEGDLATELRQRGIFSVPIYTAKLALSGSFSPAQFARYGINPEELDWTNAAVVVGVQFPRTLRSDSKVNWNGADTELESAADAGYFEQQGVSARVAILRDELDKSHAFSISLTFSGSTSLQILPVGNSNEVKLASSWPHPSFVGSPLPVRREIKNNGFSAQWQISRFGRSVPQVVRVTDGSSRSYVLGADDYFGVNLCVPVDVHVLSGRAIKYQILLIFLVFSAYFLFEVYGKARMHEAQYFMVGAALVLFYLLLLSLAEHLGFAAAYLLAAAMSTGLIAGYSRAVLGSKGRAALVSVLLALEYCYFYILLQLEDFALLSGALGLTAILAAVMYATRNIDWYKVAARQAEPAPVSPAQ